MAEELELLTGKKQLQEIKQQLPSLNHELTAALNEVRPARNVT